MHMDDNAKMRQLFENAIRVQEDIIEDANRAISHYRYALGEMDRQEAQENKIIEVEYEER